MFVASSILESKQNSKLQEEQIGKLEDTIVNLKNKTECDSNFGEISLYSNNIFESSHYISVTGNSGINFRTRSVSKNELEELIYKNSVSDESYITKLSNGHPIQILACKNNWLKIKTKFNNSIFVGFISGLYVGKETIKPLESPHKWKGIWNSTWSNTIAFNGFDHSLNFAIDNHRLEGLYSYKKNNHTVNGKIFNITAKGSTLIGDWIDVFVGGKEICKGKLEFIMLSDNRSFLGRYKRDCENNGNYHYW
ncbi:MAG: hypothetical protein HQL69_07255 [Magnetococcales bacterium]|nr:hypothetical protein [Magnetococcales bacterium]